MGREPGSMRRSRGEPARRSNRCKRWAERPSFLGPNGLVFFVTRW
jgi:hypothetical protein